MKPAMTIEFRRGARAAADVADAYNASTSHSHRLGDCVLAKLNLTKRKPRRNRQAQAHEEEAWVHGFAVALAEVLDLGAPESAVCAAARAAGLTIASARSCGVDAFDLKRLKRAGVRW